jgi:hypothetical protein
VLARTGRKFTSPAFKRLSREHTCEVTISAVSSAQALFLKRFERREIRIYIYIPKCKRHEEKEERASRNLELSPLSKRRNGISFPFNKNPTATRNLEAVVVVVGGDFNSLSVVRSTD